MPFLASSLIYGSSPTTRQMLIGAIIFLLTALTPLLIMVVSLHRLPRPWRAGIDVGLAIIFTFLGGGVYAEGEGIALLFSVIAVGASVDMFHLGGALRQIGLFTLVFSALVLIASVQPAFIHALCSSYHY